MTISSQIEAMNKFELKKAYDDLAKEFGLASEIIEHHEQEIEAQKEVIAGLRATAHEAGWPTREREYKRQIAELQETIKALEIDVSNNETDVSILTGLDYELTTLRDKLAGQHEQIMRQAEMIANLKLEMDALRKNYDSTCQEVVTLQFELLKVRQELDQKTLSLATTRTHYQTEQARCKGLAEENAGLKNELTRKDYEAQELQLTINQQKELLDRFATSQEHLAADRDHLRQVSEVAGRHKRVLVAAIEFHQQQWQAMKDFAYISVYADNRELYRVLEQVTQEDKSHAATTND